MRPFSTASRVAVALIAMAARCGACTVVFPDVRVGPNFRVRVEDRGRPVKGVQVEVRRYQSRTIQAEAITGTDGLALLRDMRPGSYSLGIARDAGIPDGAGLEVNLDGPAEATVPLKWPNTEPVIVRSLKGAIHSHEYLPGQSQPRLSLELLEGVTGRVLKAGQTTITGEFNFGDPRPGLYFLNLRPSGLRDWAGEQITGLIAVAVDPNALTDHLDLDLAWSSCGLMYTDRSKCPQSDLYVDHVQGRVFDAGGAAIEDAEILLFDSGNTLVERTRSDREGEFDSPSFSTGAYQLVVRTAGFTVLRTTVHVEPTGKHLTVNVQLGVGSCSVAKAE